MRIGILAKNRDVYWTYRKEIKKCGFDYGLKNADIILAMGGDGTLLESERRYPNIPKMLIKDSAVCNKCNITLFDKFLDIVNDKKYRIEDHDKLEAYINGKKTRFLAVNDIIIRNAEVTQAIRFDIYIDDKKLDDFIGDGVVIATPFGSSAYYQSISKKNFGKGIGLALNNVTKLIANKVFDRSAKIKFIINRGKAVVGCDNYYKKFKIKPYDEVVVKTAKNKMKLVVPSNSKA